MTAAIVTHRLGGESAAARAPKSAGDVQTRDWRSLYQMQRLERRLRGEDSGAAEEGAASSSPERSKVAEKIPQCLATVVISAGGHPELAVIESGKSATAPALSEDPIASEPADASLHPAKVTGQGGEPVGGAPHLVRAAGRSGEAGAQRTLNPAVGLSLSSLSDAIAGVTQRESWTQHELAKPLAGPRASAVAGLASAPAGSVLRPYGALRHGCCEAEAPAGPALDITGSPAMTSGSLAEGARSHEDDQSPERRQQGMQDTGGAEGDAVAVAAQRYGTVPLLISGQLFELEFVAISSSPGRAPPQAAQRILVTYQIPGRARVELTAQNHGDRVTVTLEQGSGAAMGAHRALDIPALLQRLGWGSFPVEIAVGTANESGIGAMR